MANRSRGISFVVNGIFAITLLCLLIGFLGKYHWFFDLFSNFRVYYGLVLLVLLLFQIRFTMRKALILNALVIAFILISVLPYFIPRHLNNTAAQQLRICTINLERSNNAIRPFEALIEDKQPDVLLMQEVTPAWEKLINASTIDKAYPYQLKDIRTGYYGIALFSKFPFSGHNPKIYLHKGTIITGLHQRKNR